jgi:hypothetical protein
MKGIALPEFGGPDNFINLFDIVVLHAKMDSLWAEELAKVTDTSPRQVTRFMEHPRKVQVVL